MKFCSINECTTAAECGYAGECLKARSALPTPEPQGQSARSSLATGSMLFAVRVLSGDTRYSADEKIFNAGREIARRYVELRMKMSFQEAADQSKAEWLAQYLSSNT
jgi:hypothetical protein